MYNKHEEWWPQVRIAVRAYKQRKKKKYLMPRERQEVEAIERAVKWVQAMPDGDAILKMIKLYHINQTHELRGAADEAGYSYSVAVQKNHMFMRRCAQELGYERKRATGKKQHGKAGKTKTGKQEKQSGESG